MMKKIIYQLSLLLLVLPLTISNSFASLAFPVDCNIGKDCWIVNLHRHYRSDDYKEKQVDFLCGPKTYDGHKGTDFAIRDMEIMEQGVDVLASVDGVVRGARDGMEDINVREIGEDVIKGKECGNGVVLRAGDMEYQYCHLKNGSVLVDKGDTVKKGDIIGQIGMSGNTEYPHLHLSVRKKHGETWIEYDPFYGKGKKCGLEPKPIWDNAKLLLKHSQTGIVYNYGFSYDVPDIIKVRKGIYNNIKYTQNPKMIAGWVEIFSANAGDKVAITIYGDQSEASITNQHEFKKYKARYFFYIGKKLRGKDLSSATKMQIDYYHSNGEEETFEKYL